MADQSSAAPATANAAAAVTSSSGSASTSSPTNLKRPLSELLADASVDVEAILAGSEPLPAGETEPQAAAPEAQAPTDDARSDAAADEQPRQPEDNEPEADASEDEPAPDASDEEKAEVVEDQHGKKLINVRHFNRMLRQRNEAKAQVREIEARLNEALAQAKSVDDKPVVVPVADDPLSSVATESALEEKVRNAQAWRSWARRNPHGGIPYEGAPELTAEQVVDALEQAEAILEAAPKKQAFLKEFAAHRSEVRKVMPQMFTAGTPEHTEAESLRARLLNFRSAADQDAIIAKLLRIDRMDREERTGAARYPRVEIKKSEPAGSTAPRVVTNKPSPRPAATPSATPAMRTSGTSNRQSLEQRLRDESVVDVEELFNAGVMH